MATHAPIMGAGKRAPKIPATPWIKSDGKRPDLPGYVFVYVHFSGESREAAEAYRDGYGQSVDSVHSWAEVIEYRRKHASDVPPATVSDQTPLAILRALPGPLARKYAKLDPDTGRDLERARRLAELFKAFDRDDMECAVDLLLAEMDARDGDADLELYGDESDTNNAEDEVLGGGALQYADRHPGCPISDPGGHDHTGPEDDEDDCVAGRRPHLKRIRRERCDAYQRWGTTYYTLKPEQPREREILRLRWAL